MHKRMWVLLSQRIWRGSLICGIVLAVVLAGVEKRLIIPAATNTLSIEQKREYSSEYGLIQLATVYSYYNDAQQDSIALKAFWDDVGPEAQALFYRPEGRGRLMVQEQRGYYEEPDYFIALQNGEGVIAFEREGLWRDQSVAVVRRLQNGCLQAERLSLIRFKRLALTPLDLMRWEKTHKACKSL